MDMKRALVLSTLLVAAAAFDPHPYFLTKNEITDSRGQSQRTHLNVVTEGNGIEPLIDGESFMKTLHDDLVATKKGDFIHATFFDEIAEIALDPDASDAKKTEASQIQNVLLAAIKRGVEVRMLANLNLYLPVNSVKFCHIFNPVCGHTCCAPDGRHHVASGSLHNKMWIIQRNGEAVAYVGSMDPAKGRWDTSSHNQSPERKMVPPEMVNYYGWHGNMFRIRGPAVQDLALHFWQRWNDPREPSPTYGVKKFDFEPLNTPKSGDLQMQVVRTLACMGAESDGLYQNFARHGEYSFMASFRKLVNSAKKYLYIADQFVFYDEAVKMVADALPRLEKVVILTDDAHSWAVDAPLGISIEWLSNMRYYYQYEAFKQFGEDKEHAHKVQAYHLVRPGHEFSVENMIYVHTKNYIADDEFMIVGSGGIEQAGFTNDIEVAVGVYDSGPNNAVKQFRKQLFAEHLQLDINDPVLDDPMDAIGEWEKQAATRRHRVRPYWPNKVGKSWYFSYVYGIYEPDGRCSAQNELELPMAEKLSSTVRAAQGEATSPATYAVIAAAACAVVSMLVYGSYKMGKRASRQETVQASGATDPLLQ